MANYRPSNNRLGGEFHQAVVDLLDEGRQFALAVVLNATGSTPRSAGTKAIIDSTGSIWGTIGGGPLESEAQRRAIKSLRLRRSVVFDFNLAGSNAGADERVCDGTVRLLIDPVTPEERSVYSAAAEAMRRRERGVLVTIIAANDKRSSVQWLPGGALPVDLNSNVAQTISLARTSGAPQYFVCDDRRRASPSSRPSPVKGEGEGSAISSGSTSCVDETASIEGLAEPLIPTPLLIISGGGHVGQALAEQARLVGFDIVVIEDRPEFADASRYSTDITVRRGKLPELISELPVTQDVYVAIVGRGHMIDAEALTACIDKTTAYIGMLGSRRKVALMRQDFLESGKATGEQFDRVHAPIGLEIGAETVPEIAASIVAELIAVRRGVRVNRKRAETADERR